MNNPVCPNCARTPDGLCHRCALLYTGTHAQASALEYIHAHLTSEGHCLRSAREIAFATGCTTNVIFTLLRHMRAAGVVSRVKYRTYCIHRITLREKILAGERLGC